MVFEGTDGRYQHHSRRLKTRHPRFDVDKLFSAKIRAKTGLGHDVVGEFKCRPGRHDGITAMCNIRKGTAMNEG